MKLTEEQLKIIRSEGNIRINAVAGSGKTTTLIEYAATRPENSRILYLAFNKSVKAEAEKKFAQKGLHHVKVETAHSLAYRHIVHRSDYKVCSSAYKTHEIAEILGIKGQGEKHAEYIIANHINKFITYFCNSNKIKVRDLNYLDVVRDKKAKDFVRAFYHHIEEGARKLLAKMDKAEIPVTHDFYLKKFQLSLPRLPFDYILFDEAQDASPAMLDVFLKQDSIKIIVGDKHQQIYAWRHAVNSLEQVPFPDHYLNSSFRFCQDIANLASKVISLKSTDESMEIKGKGSTKEVKSVATIARTNLGLLLKAIEFITEKKGVQKIHFEGNIHSYTYADDGASLYDVLNLYNGKPDKIRDKIIRSMKDLDELEEYIHNTEDVQLSMMLEIVKEYGNEIPGLLNKLKEKHVGHEEKSGAEMIFSTVHKAKGMEYDAVHLAGDFVTESRLKKMKEEEKENTGPERSKEEINLLYVGITRTKNMLYIPENLLPEDFPPSSKIVVTSVKKEEAEKTENLKTSGRYKRHGRTSGEKSYSNAYTHLQTRQMLKENHRPWTSDADQELIEMFDRGVSLGDMADYFGKSKGSVYSRLRKLNIGDY